MELQQQSGKALGLGGLFRPQVSGLHMQQKILFSYKEPCLVYLEISAAKVHFPALCSYHLQLLLYSTPMNDQGMHY